MKKTTEIPTRKGLLIAITFITFIAFTTKAEAIDISNCTNITASGSYQLVNNITVSDPNTTYCILINASNVVLNGQGYYISSNVTGWASDKGTAVRIYSGSGYEQGNVAVGNMTINGWRDGMDTSDSYGVDISNIEMYNNSNMNQFVTWSRKVKLSKLNIYAGTAGFSTVGVFMYNASDTELYDSSIQQQMVAVEISHSSNATVDRTRIFWSGYGIIFDNTEALVYDNLFAGNSYSDLYYYGDTSGIKLNTSLQQRTNVMSQPYVCGNYWDKFDKCVDTDSNGVCENAYTPLAPLTDYCPLNYVNTLSACSKIDRSGTYVLANDIEIPLDLDPFGDPIYDKCFSVENVDEFTLDCKGHTITGIGRAYPDKTSYIFYLRNDGSVKIVNCNLKDSSTAIQADSIGKLEVYSNNIIADKQTVSLGMIAILNSPSSFVGNNKIYGSNTTHFSCLNYYKSKGSIFDNYIQNCYYGIFIESSYNSFAIYNNYFAKNTYDFSQYDSCSQQLNIPRTSEINIIGGSEKGGNYWDKYSCVNIDGDSFCDDAYVLDTCNKDELPLASAVTYYTVLPTVIQPFISPYTLFIALLAGMGVGLDFTAKAGGKVLLLVLVIGIMGAVYLSLFPSWILLVFIVVAGFMIAYMVIRFIGGAV